jgi:Spy/CpxP family protein refolding chaperone
VSTNDWSEPLRKLLATLAAAAAALGIAAATMSAATPNSPATDADVVASGSFGSGQAYVLLPYIEQDNIYRQF